jgi:hypothetical protein
MTNQIVPGGALAAVKMARKCLTDAQFRLYDDGLECELLDRLQGATAALASVWQGRTPPKSSVPDHVAEAAVAWRAERDRRLRR